MNYLHLLHANNDCVQQMDKSNERKKNARLFLFSGVLLAAGSKAYPYVLQLCQPP